MKSYIKILFGLIVGSFVYSATNEITLPDRVQEAQSLLIKQAFLCIKPETETFSDAFESVQKFIKEENTNKVLIGVRQLFPDRISYLKALATQAEAEKFPAVAALLWNRPFEEESLKVYQDRIKHNHKINLLGSGAGMFFLGLAVGGRLCKKKILGN
jgi:hypothetical protein